MAHLWLREASDSWSPAVPAGDTPAMHPARLLRRSTSQRDVWVLVGPPCVRVNGDPLDTGIRVLRDRDELRAATSRIFFSVESLPVIEPFPGSAQPTFCPRCKLEIAPGSPAVCCPQCSVWHHQSDELPCWTYAECCTLCDQPTPLDAGFRWTPEDL